MNRGDGFGALGQKEADAIAPPDAPACEPRREPIGGVSEFTIRQRAAGFGGDGRAVGMPRHGRVEQL